MYGRRVDFDLVPAGKQRRQLGLVGRFDLSPCASETGVLGMRLELGEAVEVTHPAVTDRLADQVCEARVGQCDEAPRCDAVGDVGELLREDLGEVVQGVVAQQPRVELGDAVDGTAADRGEVCHPEPALGLLLDQRHPGDAGLVPGEALADAVEKASVDLVDDLEVAWQQSAERLHRPGLEGLREEGVTGVGEAAPRDLPGRLPAEPVDVDQQPHQLGDRDDRVGVVELDGHLVGQCRPVTVAQAEAAQDVVQRAGDEEVLLLETQLAAGGGRVVGVEDLGDGLRVDLVGDRALKVADLEQLEVELAGGPCPPQPEEVDRGGAPTGNQGVVWLAEDPLLGLPADREPTAGFGRVDRAAAEADLDHVVWLGKLPRVAVVQPRVGALDLATIAEALAEDPVLVADTIAHRGDVEGRHRVQVARGQAAETAVAQAGLRVELEQLVEGNGGRLESPPRQLQGARDQQVLRQLTAREVLGGEVVDELRVGLELGLGGPPPAVHEAVAHGHREGPV